MDEIILKYIGKGDFIIGIPAKDLTAAEVKEYGGVVALVATGLYERRILSKVEGVIEKPAKVKSQKKPAKVTKELPSGWQPYVPSQAGDSSPKDGE